MKAVVYQEPFKVSIESVADPQIGHPNDAIVRVTSSCICGSDFHMYEGRTAAEPGIVFGHENMGTIEEVGPAVEERKVGDRVVMPFNVACGFCKNCLNGFTGFCTVVNPGFCWRGLRICGYGTLDGRAGGVHAGPIRRFQLFALAAGD